VNAAAILVNRATVIDLAFWKPHEKAFAGASFNVHCLLSGPVDGNNRDEGVVADFSTAKKTIKRDIDQHIDPYQFDSPTDAALANGFDHKLVLPTKEFFRPLTGEESQLFESAVFKFERTGETHCLVTNQQMPQFRLLVPLNALRLVPADVLFDLEKEVFTPFEKYLGDFLQQSLPGVTIKSFVDQRPDLGPLGRLLGGKCHIEFFDYAHGLRHSSSYGCQNILHGHLSFVASMDPSEAQQISKYLNGAYLYQSKVTHGSVPLRIEYHTDARGEFSYQPGEGDHQNNLNLGNEPTVENLGAHIASVLKTRSPFFLSEGLQKGCLVDGRS